MIARLLPFWLGLLLTASARAQFPALDPLPPPSTQPATSKPDEGVEDEAAFDDLVARSILPAHRWVEISSDTQAFHTSNVLLLPDLNRTIHPIEDAVVLQGVNVTLTPPAWHGLTASGFFRHQFVRYIENDALNFQSQSAGLRLNYPLEWFTLYSGFSAQRQFQDRAHEDFFKMYDTQFGLFHAQPLCPRASLVAGYQLDWRASSPAELDRLDNAVYAGLSLALCRHVNADLLYRLSLQDYLNNGRTDLNHLFTATLTYTINDYVRLHGFIDYGHNDSNTFGRDYTVFDGGAGFNLSVRF